MQTFTAPGSWEQPVGKPIESRPDLWVCVALLLLVNGRLFLGRWVEEFIFLPNAVAAGEWWRVLSAPFAHNSVYHLAVDVVAFVLLYSAVSQSLGRRLFLLGASAMGGLLVPLWVAPEIKQIGLCGMSGVAHGLMAVCAIELCGGKGKSAKIAGGLSFFVVIFKCIAEAVTGRLALDVIHFGNVGVPIVSCHVGGVLGALLAMTFLSRRTARTRHW